MNKFIVGLPLNQKSVTNQFKEFLDSNVETIMVLAGTINMNPYLVTQEYKSCSIGYDMLFDASYEFVKYEGLDITKLYNSKKIVIALDDIWVNAEKNRTDPNIVGKTILDLMNNLSILYKDKRIVMIAPGSPYLYDSVASYLFKYCPLIEVINTKSSAQLSYEEMDEQKLTENLPMVIVPTHFRDGDFKSNSVNLIGCIGYVYKNYERLDKLIAHISDTDTLYSIKLGEENVVTKISIEDLPKMFIRTPDYRPTTLAIVKH